MAKKKIEETDSAPMSKEDLEAKFALENKDAKSKKKPLLFKEKKDFDIAKYSKMRSNAVEYKPETWIPMSTAFQKLTGFPGFPQGHVHMCYGRSDQGKTTMLLELAVNAQKIGVYSILIITEKKWSWDRCDEIGFDRNFCAFKDDLTYVEEVCDYINDVLRDQAEGNLPYDIIFLWDSVGATPSRAEWEASEERAKLVRKAVDDGVDLKEIKMPHGGMMITARVLKDYVERKLQHKILATRNASFPFFATLFMINHGYTSPNPMGPASLVPSGGEGLKFACSFVFRQGKVSGNPERVKAVKKGIDTQFGIVTPLILEKNHINGISQEGKIVCTPHGFVENTKIAIEEYKDAYKKGWDIQFEKYFEGDSEVDIETGEIL